MIWRGLSRSGILMEMKQPAPDNLVFHAQSVQTVQDQLGVTVTSGLTDAQVAKRFETYGRNVLPAADKRSALRIFLSQFTSGIVVVLLAAAVISAYYHHYLDSAIILSIVLANAILGFVQEFQAEKSFEALRRLMVPKTLVRRNHRELVVSSHELVPGDIILINGGDIIPADARVLISNQLLVNESSLTGESLPVKKRPEGLAAETPMAEQTNMVWMSATVMAGSGEAIVTATGTSTMLGGIAASLKGMQEQPDHFKTKTNQLAKQMTTIAVATVAVIFLVGYFARKMPFEDIFMYSVASLVSAIPEGLPVMLTVVLALSAKRMAKRKALVRRLSCTETLAVVNTIVTDKTGTLTQNKMAVTNIALPYQPPILVTTSSDKITITQAETVPTTAHYPLKKLIDIAGSCTAVRREFDADGTETILGDATEVALVTLSDQANQTSSYDKEAVKQIDDLPFNQDTRLRASLVRYETSDENQVFTIGSPESILERCVSILLPDHQEHPLSKEHKQTINTQLNELTAAGRRVLALAYQSAQGVTKLHDQAVQSLTFVGLVGMIDPPRKAAKQAIALAQKAGIQIIMATGDHPVTAAAIGRELGLLTETDDKAVLTEAEFSKLTEPEAKEALKHIKILARMTPAAKMHLAELLQANGRVVAMTGDGVNDAPALKRADIGIAMGKNGTDVAREASDIILLDDNFATIVAAIEEGRTQLRNVRRTSFFYITTNLAETLTLMVFLFLGLPIPLLPKQILWLNVVTAGVTDLALATEPPHEDVLRAPPKSVRESILNRQVIPHLIIIVGTIMGLAILFFFLYQDQGLEKARTMVFVVLVLAQFYTLLNLRSVKRSLFSIGVFSSRNVNWALLISFVLLFAVIFVPIIARAFEFEVIGLTDLIIGLVATSLVLWLTEGYKRLIRYGAVTL